jgi:hypothetical protein
MNYGVAGSDRGVLELHLMDVENCLHLVLLGPKEM